jgi:hypothetical protein
MKKKKMNNMLHSIENLKKPQLKISFKKPENNSDSPSENLILTLQNSKKKTSKD